MEDEQLVGMGQDAMLTSAGAQLFSDELQVFYVISTRCRSFRFRPGQSQNNWPEVISVRNFEVKINISKLDRYIMQKQSHAVV